METGIIFQEQHANLSPRLNEYLREEVILWREVVNNLDIIPSNPEKAKKALEQILKTLDKSLMELKFLKEQKLLATEKAA